MSGTLKKRHHTLGTGSCGSLALSAVHTLARIRGAAVSALAQRPSARALPGGVASMSSNDAIALSPAAELRMKVALAAAKGDPRRAREIERRFMEREAGASALSGGDGETGVAGTGGRQTVGAARAMERGNRLLDLTFDYAGSASGGSSGAGSLVRALARDASPLVAEIAVRAALGKSESRPGQLERACLRVGQGSAWSRESEGTAFAAAQRSRGQRNSKTNKTTKKRETPDRARANAPQGGVTLCAGDGSGGNGDHALSCLRVLVAEGMVDSAARAMATDACWTMLRSDRSVLSWLGEAGAEQVG